MNYTLVIRDQKDMFASYQFCFDSDRIALYLI